MKPYTPIALKMDTETTRLTVRLPRRDVEFAKAYAKEHGLSVTEVIDRYLRRLRALEQRMASSDLEAITGLVPGDERAEEEYRRHLRDEHR